MTATYSNPAIILLQDELEARGISQAAAARAMAIPRSRLTDIIHARKRISIDTALRLEHFLAVRASLWLNLQQDHELRLARQIQGKQLAIEITPCST